jgi:hypothetical protein
MSDDVSGGRTPVPTSWQGASLSGREPLTSMDPFSLGASVRKNCALACPRSAVCLPLRRPAAPPLSARVSPELILNRPRRRSGELSGPLYKNLVVPACAFVQSAYDFHRRLHFDQLGITGAAGLHVFQDARDKSVAKKTRFRKDRAAPSNVYGQKRWQAKQLLSVSFKGTVLSDTFRGPYSQVSWLF